MFFVGLIEGKKKIYFLKLHVTDLAGILLVRPADQRSVEPLKSFLCAVP